MRDRPDSEGPAEVGKIVRGPDLGTLPGPDRETNIVVPPAQLPSLLDVPEAAQILGIGRTLAYELVRTNQWPTPVIRVGRLIKIPPGPLIDLVLTGETRAAAAS